MKTFIYIVLSFLFFGITAEAHADWWYKETPSFLSDQYPDTLSCRTDGLNHSGKLSVLCYPKGIAATEQVLVKTTDGKVQVESHDTVAIANCSQGLCVDTRYGDYMGKLDLSRLPDASRKILGLDFIKVFSGYYLHLNDDDIIVAYRVGTGPLADDFPIPLIEDDAGAFYHDLAGVEETTESAITVSAPQGSSMSGGQTDETYDLWCDPRGDYCYYTTDDGTGYELTREELTTYIPIAQDTSDCDMEVCYDADMNVIGLNPQYHLYD